MNIHNVWFKPWLLEMNNLLTQIFNLCDLHLPLVFYPFFCPFNKIQAIFPFFGLRIYVTEKKNIISIEKNIKEKKKKEKKK